MDKVLVCVLVPSIGQKFDVTIPKYMMIEAVIQLLAEALSGITNNNYSSSRTELLCWVEKEIVLSGKKTFSDYGIRNGDVLYFY